MPFTWVGRYQRRNFGGGAGEESWVKQESGTLIDILVETEEEAKPAYMELRGEVRARDVPWRVTSLWMIFEAMAPNESAGKRAD